MERLYHKKYGFLNQFDFRYLSRTLNFSFSSKKLAFTSRLENYFLQRHDLSASKSENFLFATESKNFSN